MTTSNMTRAVGWKSSTAQLFLRFRSYFRDLRFRHMAWKFDRWASRFEREDY